MADLNNGASINSLETYFSHIEALVGMTKGNDTRYGRKYSILPVMSEDDYFIIDANARTIKVPDNFRKNGLGVQGDQTAETIYFKINRYFDAMDLNNTDIYIQWENARGEQGLAKEWVRDIETFDDYMIFGWVLGDAITSEPGTLKFSIRFIKTTGDENNKKVTYSLNTLIAQAMINSSLDLPIGTADDALNDLLAGNFQDTKTHTDSEVRLFKFVYNFDNLLKEKDENNNIPNLNGQVISADLIDGKLEFVVSAYIEPGTLTYDLYKQNNDKPEPNNADKLTKQAMSFDYRLTPDKAVNIHKVYYKKEGEEYKKASLVEMGGENAAIQTGTYYEKYGVYTLTENNKLDNKDGITGYYYAAAVGQMADGSKTSPMISDYKVLLSPPTKATINGELNISGKEIGSSIIVNASIPENNVPTYVWSIKRYGQTNYTLVEEIEQNSYTPVEEALYQLEVKTTRNLDSIISDTKAIYCVTKKPEAEKEIQIKINGGSFYAGVIGPQASYVVPNAIAPYGLTYQWYVVDEEDEKIAIEGANAETYNATAGKYCCEIIATYNGLSDSYMTNIFEVAEIN